MDLKYFFSARTEDLILSLDLNERVVPRRDDRESALLRAERELNFVRREGLRILCYGYENYPRRLSFCPEAPLVLYVKGDADLDAEKIISVVGTRRCTQTGTGFVDKMISEFGSLRCEATVVSGLAYGIDTAAHEASLKAGLPTVAVLAHSLDTIYPPMNRNLARDILAARGALVSEYPSGTRPFRPNFLERNRIVAGLADITVVVESEVKGGAMSTARHAFEYDREVAAVPGRYLDTMSSGCHLLIRSQRASLVTSAKDIMDTMGWKVPLSSGQTEVQSTGNIFGALEGDEKIIYEILLKADEAVPITLLQSKLGLKIAEVLSLLGEMELDGLVHKLPGNKFVAVR